MRRPRHSGAARGAHPHGRGLALTAFVAAASMLLVGHAAEAGVPQVRISPGPLARAHANLEGVGNCSRCHDAVRGVSAERCLKCHKPIAARIAARTGVHRAVTDDCVRCHVEHRGVETDLRRIDTRTFDHVQETGFPLVGRHAKVAATCAVCHKKRSFIAARRACASCHPDPHKAALDQTCTECHSPEVAFKETRRQFDHARAKFTLTGAHRAVACEKCHLGGVFRGLRFDSCSACHKAPHRHTLGPSCTTCHVTDRWATRTVEHARTGFTLVGAHLQVPCAKCHQAGVKKPLQFDRCSACHANVHRDSIKDDCRKCHKETSFREATFEHGERTSFPLAGRHAGLPCRKCHAALSPDGVPPLRKVMDFGGASPACVSCHKDQHKAEYGRLCDACHRPTTFKAAGFAHPRSPEFFGGRHQAVACVRCHVRASSPRDPAAGGPAPGAGPTRATTPSMACRGCHEDVHLGQVGTSCERCHAIDAAKFAPARFSHDSVAFPLTGKHRSAPCTGCHPAETRVFPAGQGTAKRLNPMPTECRVCHKDPHLGQVPSQCATCHSTSTFKVTAYSHPGQEYTFGVASHARLPCASCHKTETRQYPAGWGTAIRFQVGRTCLACHP